MRIVMLRDQFGPEGPALGDEGEVLAGPFWDDVDSIVWYQCIFDMFPGEVYNVDNTMIAPAY